MTMTLDQAIVHAKEEAASLRKEGKEECAVEHEQLACWLMELKERRKSTPSPQEGLRTV